MADHCACPLLADVVVLNVSTSAYQPQHCDFAKVLTHAHLYSSIVTWLRCENAGSAQECASQVLWWGRQSETEVAGKAKRRQKEDAQSGFSGRTTGCVSCPHEDQQLTIAARSACPDTHPADEVVLRFCRHNMRPAVSAAGLSIRL